MTAIDDEVHERVAKMQSCTLNYGVSIPRCLHRLVSLYGSSVGCPKEFILLLLLSTCAHFMGPAEYVEVHAQGLARTGNSLDSTHGA